ncbi:MAG: hypothetical protein RLZZ253_183 [Verrucomicrobiota bacterium]
MIERADILLVEDNPADIELARHAFSRCRVACRFDVVKDGEEALDFLFCRGVYAKRERVEPPRCVLLDLKLPKVDGLEVLRQLKEAPLLRRVPVIVLSSSSQASDIARSYDLGANSYLVKPLEFGEFTQLASDISRYWLELNQDAQQGMLSPSVA